MRIQSFLKSFMHIFHPRFSFHFIFYQFHFLTFFCLPNQTDTRESYPRQQHLLCKCIFLLHCQNAQNRLIKHVKSPINNNEKFPNTPPLLVLESSVATRKMFLWLGIFMDLCFYGEREREREHLEWAVCI